MSAHSVPLVPFSGRMSYCLIRSLKMVLEYRGQTYPTPWLECVSGEPFGFVYVRQPDDLFAINGYAYHLAGEHLLRTLNYEYTYTGASNAEEALAALDTALLDGPVVAGMLDMGYLTYAPDHEAARGADHAIVVLTRDGESVTVHDPAGYPCVPLPLNDFLEAWQRDIYTGKPYGLWRIGMQGEPPDAETIWNTTLARAHENFAKANEEIGNGVSLLYGPGAMRTLAGDLRAEPERSLGALPYFNWRVSAQRCMDSAVFVRERLPEAAAIRWEETRVYGEIQRSTVEERRADLPTLIEELAVYETAFIAALAEHW
ncbi:MAG TPA: BtrH N-terminal domain-containing protein [Ktedonobacterales bacterium]|nr:BtrH N-terminal domain-containing protein [Ktedonobacterales bacterium]